MPTLGDWFRAGGYRTYFKGKWHASHAHLDADDGDGLPALDRRRRRRRIEENIERYLKADLLDEFGFSEWVGPEPHGLGKHNTGTVKDVVHRGRDDRVAAAPRRRRRAISRG